MVLPQEFRRRQDPEFSPDMGNFPPARHLERRRDKVKLKTTIPNHPRAEVEVLRSEPLMTVNGEKPTRTLCVRGRDLQTSFVVFPRKKLLLLWKAIGIPSEIPLRFINLALLDRFGA